jgi:hypothetical protein
MRTSHTHRRVATAVSTRTKTDRGPAAVAKRARRVPQRDTAPPVPPQCLALALLLEGNDPCSPVTLRSDLARAFADAAQLLRAPLAMTIAEWQASYRPAPSLILERLQQSREYAELMTKVPDPGAGDEIETAANCLVMDAATEGLLLGIGLAYQFVVDGARRGQASS